MMSKNPMEKRKNVRNNLHCQIVLQGINQEGKPFELTGQSVDISRTGCGIILDQDITSLGSVVNISSARKFRSEANVQWIRRDPQTGKVGVGLRLVKPRMNFAFKIAVSLLLCWAFLAQATMARSSSFSSASSGRSDVPRQEQLISAPAPLPTGAIALEGERSWIQEAVMEAAKHPADTGNTQVRIAVSQTNYLAGETITAGTYHISNPSNHDQHIELKTWLTGPEGKPVPVGNVGADGQYQIPSGSDEEYGPVQVLPVTDQMSAGHYEFSTRMLDPVTGEVLGENIKSFTISTTTEAAPRIQSGESASILLDMQTSKSSYTRGEEVSLIEGCRIINQTSSAATVEVKIWLEGPGLSPINVMSMGGDGSLILTPNAKMKLDPLQTFKVTQDLPAGTYHLKSRILDPVTGQGFTQTVNSFDIR